MLLAIFVAVAVMVHSCVAGLKDNPETAGTMAVQTAASSESASAASASSASSDASAASASSDSADAAASDESASASATNVITAAAEDASKLSGRDKEFAVDPSFTDWNYESNGEKIVYLTFDDGPSDNTQEVLDILDKYGCKATFFVVGHDDAYFHMIKEAYDRGHTIGLHSGSHDYEQIYSSEDAFFADLDQIAAIVKDQIGFVPCFIRFPGGSSNTISANYSQGIMSALVNDVQARGFQYYDWNASCGDGSNISTEETVFYATEDLPEMDNIVMLMHDATTKDTTVEALPAIIEYYQERGYEFKAIDRTSMVPHHGVNN